MTVAPDLEDRVGSRHLHWMVDQRPHALHKAHGMRQLGVSFERRLGPRQRE